MTKPDYAALAGALENAVPKARIATGPLQRLSYGTDASFYRLIPEIVVTVESETGPLTNSSFESENHG